MGKVQSSTPLYKIIERWYKKALHILQYFPLFVVMGVKGNGKVFEEWQRPPAPGDYLGEVFSCHLFLLFMNEPCTPCNHRKVLHSSLPRYYYKCYKLPHYLLVYLWDCTHWLKNDSLSVFHRAQLMEFSLFPRPQIFLRALSSGFVTFLKHPTCWCEGLWDVSYNFHAALLITVKWICEKVIWNFLFCPLMIYLLEISHSFFYVALGGKKCGSI